MIPAISDTWSAPGPDVKVWKPFLAEHGDRLQNSPDAQAYLRRMARANWTLKDLASCSLGQRRLLEHAGVTDE